jgi:hypothetical protein
LKQNFGKRICSFGLGNVVEDKGTIEGNLARHLKDHANGGFADLK